MQMFIRCALLAFPAIIASQIPLVLKPAIAEEIQGNFESTAERQTPSGNLFDEPIIPYRNEDSAETDPFAQVTSVSQLSDVQPTDWAFSALQSLVERYGCIAGYPDGTFRGNQAMTRYEFAAGLNACMDKIFQLVGGENGANLATKEDLAILQRLADEFAVELATLRGRVDSLEARTAEIEANQFSTTTKLQGFIAFNLTGAFSSDDVKVEGRNLFVATRDPVTRSPMVRTVTEEDDPNTTFSSLVWLTLNTSFTGKDTLITQLTVGNGFSPANQFVSAGQINSTGVPFVDQMGSSNPNQVGIRELFYSFPVSNSLRATIGPQINWFRHFDNNAFTFPLTGASSFNSINSTLLTSTKRGAGVVIEWNIGKQFELHAGYLAENIEFLRGTRPAADPSKGLFEGTNTITAELTFKPSSKANIRLLYQRSELNTNQSGQINIKPIVGVADDGVGGGVDDANADTFGINFDWLLTKGIGIFGRYYYSSTHLDPVTSGIEGGDVNAQNIQAGLAFPDLGKEGALATLSFVVPFDVLDGRKFLVSGGGNGGTQLDIEASYFFPVTDNISIIPALYVIENINNFNDNPTVFIGHVRSQFRF